MTNTQPDMDVAIVGAGLSGIGMAAHMEMSCPGKSYAILERREQLGGTWDLFRYPGIRSDSDMHSLGFRFEPWIHEKSIADGPAILDYLHKIVRERGIEQKVRLGTKVVSADFRQAEALWHITVEDSEGWRELTARFLYLGSGYYDYDDPYDAGFTGKESFKGQIVHPQFWPEDLDYDGKHVVVIGSGATAVTLVPAIAGKAAHVTMLQRTPTWMGARPAKDSIANWLRDHLPGKLAYKITRAKNILLHQFMFKRARSHPQKASEFLTKKAKEALGDAWSEEHFRPPYNPWEQRLCLVPDEDFFIAMREGRASIVTDRIERFDESGLQLESGKHLGADIIVTATGLALTFGGKIDLSIGGKKIDWTRHWFYRGCMFDNVPNLAVTFGYLNASWTLRVDHNAAFLCEVFKLMDEKGAGTVYPYLPEDHGMEEDDIFSFSSGYLQRAKHLMPKSAARLPWRLNQDYLEDRKHFRTYPVDDGILRFERHAQVQELEAAE